ncbi:uncharacterized protein M6B38_182165 [Iris pallida]|uniref:Uncharacterized protein n=1 Tax=Iris pallida TaxID=29817 RepID=A0AAX6EMI3_IRIPA|nr:uncharacterized protein M6B38_182165 [Iris pallida]
MRGVGGPLLCIGDLLSDVGEDTAAEGSNQYVDVDDDDKANSPSHSPTGPLLNPSDLHRLFQDDYNKLIESLEGTDHSWTALTLKLCDALKTADKLVTSANSNIESLLEKVGELDSILKRGDAAVAVAKTIQCLPADRKES